MQYQSPLLRMAEAQDAHLNLLQTHLLGESTREPARASFAFGMHKGGSTMLHTFLAIATARSNVRAMSASNILFRAGVSDTAYSHNANLLPLFLQHRAAYIGFRFIPMFMLRNKGAFLNHRAVVLIRDPRDCVVSAYFSFLKSHVVSANLASDSAQAIQIERARYQGTGIDEYCLNEMGRFVREINGYLYFANENTRLFRYEDIIFSKRSFFASVVEHLELHITADAFDEALLSVDVIPEKERVDAHVRNVTPGDHRLKLQAATIEELTQRYSDTLELCGYA